MGPSKGLNCANSVVCAEYVLPPGRLEIGCLPGRGAHVSGPQCPLGAGSLESISLVVSAHSGGVSQGGGSGSSSTCFSLCWFCGASCHCVGVTSPEPLGSS